MSISTVAAFSAEISIDPAQFAANQTYAKDSLSPDWLNAAGQVIPNTYWTTGESKYFVANSTTTYTLQSKGSSRDQEVETWARSCRVLLRLTSNGKCISFDFNGEVANGYVAIDILTGESDASFYSERFYELWNTNNLAAMVPNYHRSNTEGDRLTFGVEGFDIYAKYNGIEFIRFKEYRHMDEGRVAFKAPQGYGYRKTIVRHRDTPKPLLSDYQNLVLDARDFGLKASPGTGSIDAGSNNLRLKAMPDPPFAQGDWIIVEIGGEGGRGRRGTIGVGGSWPAKHFPSATERDAERSLPLNTLAWLETSGSVYQWDGNAWTAFGVYINTSIHPPTTNHQYYSEQAVPRALRAKILAITPGTSILTLDRPAVASSIDAAVYYDNAYVINKLTRSPKHDGELNYPITLMGRFANCTDITPTNVTLTIPAGDYAVGEPVMIIDHSGWKLSGLSTDSTTILSPKGVSSAGIQFDESPNSIVRDMRIAGNARNEGFSLNYPGIFSVAPGGGIPETDTPQGITYRPAVAFIGSDRSRAMNLTMTDAFWGVETSFCSDVWVENCHVRESEGIAAYIRWQFNWADSIGGGCVNCSLWTPLLLGGFQSFKSKGTQFIDCSSTNGVVALNSAGDFLFKNMKVIITPGSQSQDPRWFSEYTPIVAVVPVIDSQSGYEHFGGIFENLTMIQTGYINSQKDVLKGIVINSVPNVTIRGGGFASPDYVPSSRTQAAVAFDSNDYQIRSTDGPSTNTIVDGFVVTGDADPRAGENKNINITHGMVINSVANSIKVAGPDVTLVNNRPRSNAPPVLSAISNRNCGEGQALTLTILVSDRNNSTNDTLGINQKLTFSLASGSPNGAALDPDTGLFSWTPSEEQGPGNYSITVQVADNGTPSLSGTQTFNVAVSEANTAPVLSEIPVQTVREGETLTFTLAAVDADLPKQPLAFSLGPGALPGASLDPVTGVFRWTPTFDQGRPESYVGLSSVTDGLSRVERPIGITVQNVNRAPVLEAVADQTIPANQPWTLNLKAGDADGDALTFALDPGAPAGVTLDGGTGRMAWTPSDAQGPSTNAITVRVTDNGTPSLSDTKTFIVTVRVNTAPVLTPIPDRTVDEGMIVSFTAAATDGDIPANTLTFSLSPGAPSGALINSTNGAFTWTPTETQGPSTNVITVIAADNGSPPLTATQSFQVIVREVNQPPQLTVPEPLSMGELTSLVLTNTAGDPDLPANALIFSLVDAPAGATLDPLTGVLTWSPTEAQGPSTNVITMRITDNGAPSLNATQSVTVTVTEVNSPPVLAAIPDVSIDELRELAFTATAIDPDLPANALTFTLDPGAPSGASISLEGAFRWTPTEAQGPGTYPITVRVTDDGAPPLSDTKTFTVTVNEVNEAPVLAAIPHKTANVGSPFTFAVTATDSDLPANDLSYTIEPGSPSGASIDSATGVFSWTPGPQGAARTNTFTVKVTDDGSPPLSHTASIAVSVTAPEGPKLLGSFLPNGQFQLTLSGEIGRIYLIQNSADLLVWEPVTNILSTMPTIQIVDPAASTVKQRFYRAFSP